MILLIVIGIEKDHTVYGEESKFGGGKTIRDGMSQSSTASRSDGVLDFVITSAIVIETLELRMERLLLVKQVILIQWMAYYCLHYAIHCIRITCFTNTNNLSILNSNVCF